MRIIKYSLLFTVLIITSLCFGQDNESKQKSVNSKQVTTNSSNRIGKSQINIAIRDLKKLKFENKKLKWQLEQELIRLKKKEKTIFDNVQNKLNKELSQIKNNKSNVEFIAQKAYDMYDKQFNNIIVFFALSLGLIGIAAPFVSYLLQHKSLKDERIRMRQDLKDERERME